MIHIFYMNLSSDCSYEQSLALYGILPEERKVGVKKALNTNIAKKRLYTGAFLQYVLSKEMDLPTDKIYYSYGEQGKPELDNQKIFSKMETDSLNQVPFLYFNLSHSGKYVFLAVSDRPVGIDIEHKKRNHLAVARRCFCGEEYNDIISAKTKTEQERRFLEYWTMKEAFVKYSGEGLRMPFNSFCIMRKESGISYVECPNRWFVTFFMEGETYCVSICSESLSDVDSVLKKNAGRDDRLIKVSIDEICAGIRQKL